jgi:hypothetical protein
MRLFFLFSLFPLWFVFFSCSSPEIQLSHDFEHGSLGEMEESEPDYYEGTTIHWLKRDSIGDQYYWFYFRADDVAGRKVSFELQDLIGVYRGTPHLVYTDYTQPVFSYDQENWDRITDVSYDSASHTFFFSETFSQEPVWIAYAHPYPWSRLEQLTGEIQDQPFVTIENIAKTAERRDIRLLTITDPHTEAETKKTVLIMALQHAGEDAGGFLVEGLINYLISEDPGAQEAREKFIFHIIPMMNPDGMVNGITRYNTAMEDLNNIWLNDEKAQPEVTGVKNWVENWYGQGNTIDLFIDVHNHSQFHTYHAFIFQDHSLDSLVTEMNDHWPIRIWHSEFEGSSCAWFFRQGIPSGTIELSQSRIGDGPYLTIEDYLDYGAGTVKGIAAFFDVSKR